MTVTVQDIIGDDGTVAEFAQFLEAEEVPLQMWWQAGVSFAAVHRRPQAKLALAERHPCAPHAPRADALVPHEEVRRDAGVV